MKINECVSKSLANKKGYNCGKWRTDYQKDSVIVSHYGTDMIKIPVDRTKIERAVGFESESDKLGVNKILRDLGVTSDRVKEVQGDRGFRFK